MFKVNQKIICISTLKSISIYGRPPQGHFPIKGQIYTISHLTVIEDEIYLYLKECHPNDCFAQTAFKPLEEERGSTYIADYLPENNSIDKPYISNHDKSYK